MPRRRATAALSKRELQIVDLSAQGLTDKEIAAKLGISQATVNTYWARLRTKFGVNTRTELAAAVTEIRAQSRIDQQAKRAERLRSELEVSLENEAELERRVKERTEELLRREARLQAVLGVISDAVVTIREDGTIEAFNAAAEAMFGYRAEEVVGQNIGRLMPAGDAGRHGDYVSHHLRTGEARIIGVGRSVVARHADGSDFPVWLEVKKAMVGGEALFAGLLRPIG